MSHPHDSQENHTHDHLYHDEQAHDHEHPHDHNHDHEHDHNHGHEHGHEHGHDHSHEHGHDHGSGLWGWVNTIFHLHGHSEQKAALANDQAIQDNKLGIRTIWWALAILGITALLQIGIFWLSGSVALLADTVHNIGDAVNSIPLLMAFYLARRAANRRYSYGYGRAEDVAGIIIVLSIAFSAGVIFWESIQKLFNPEPLTHLGWVAAAAIIGFVGNELVAMLQIRVGRSIGSAAMVADGLHARTDGLTSLAVLLAVAGTWLGYPIVDPIIGLLIGITILFITRDATVTMWYRLMDAIDPALLDKAEEIVQGHAAVKQVQWVRMRWMGHRLHSDLGIAVDPHLTTAASHQVAEELRHELYHAFPHLAEVVVHVDPWSSTDDEYHQLTAHHELHAQTATG
jgi:cation diffusion facilitator family transporter